MDMHQRLDLIKQVGEEIISEDELVELLKEKEHPIAYDGFEPSGRIHIAQGILRAINVNKLTKAGIKFKFWVADWFALMNNKMDGDLEKIRTVGKYFIEVWKACGMDLENVEFLWASENMGQEYWLNVIRIGTMNTVTRITRCAQIMGRTGDSKLSAAQIFYPCMQANDIFHLDVDIAQLGMDQRKVNVLAREVAKKMGKKKPIAVHHHMLMGLGQSKPALEFLPVIKEEFLAQYPDQMKTLEEVYPEQLAEFKEQVQKHYQSLAKRVDAFVDKQARLIESGRKSSDPSDKTRQMLKELKQEWRDIYGDYFNMLQTSKKMSKSNPDTAIFMTDTTKQIQKKFSKAFCPEGEAEDNPVLEYCKYIVFEKVDEFVIERPEKWGGNLTYSSYSELEKDFVEKKLHPMDLKSATAKYIDQLLEPVRAHFKENAEAKALLEKVESF
ncbi:MAG: tyrosine--tRNA ligase [Nanoarchaeota archaeon]